MKVKVTKVPSLFNDGGGIHIKPSHKGLFTEKANRHGMGVQLFASHVLANKEDYPTSTVRLANFARNATKFKHNFGGSLLYADGGLFEGSHTHGVDFIGNGDFTEFNTGSSHELNGNEGVLQGYDSNDTPNLVEQGETKYNDYIFSTRLTIPTKKELDKELKSLPEHEGGDSQRGWEISILKKWAGRTYAYASKHAYVEAEQRPNDPYSNETLDEILTVLKNSQEKLRAIKLSSELANEELQQLKQMSDKDYAELKEAEELQQLAILEQQEQLLALAEELTLLEQLLSQMSPEELQAYLQLILLQQAMLEQQIAQLGYAEGGQLSAEEQATLLQQIAASYYLYIQQTKDTNKMKALLERIAKYSQLLQQLPLEQLQIAALKLQLQCLYEAAIQDADFINLLELATKAYQLFAEGGEMIESLVTDSPQMEEAPHDELLGINPTQDVEEMSTSLLNETIDLILQWAKQNGNKDLARRARRAKKASREDKEDFVDEALEELDLYRAEQQELQRIKTLDSLKEEIPAEEELEQQEMTQDELSEVLAAQELNALMLLPQLFANGSNLFPLGGTFDIPTYIKAINEGNFLEANVEGNIPSTPNSVEEAKLIAEDPIYINFWNELIKPENWESEEGVQIRKALAAKTGVADYTTITPGYAKTLAFTGNRGYYHTPISLLDSTLNPTAPTTPAITTNETTPETSQERTNSYIRHYILGEGTPNWTEAELKNKVLASVGEARQVNAAPKGYKISTTTSPITLGDTTYNFYEPYDLENRYFTKEGLDYRNTLNDLERALFDTNPRRYLELQGYSLGSGEDEYDDEKGIKRTTYIVDNTKKDPAEKDPIPRYDSRGDKIALGLTGLGLAHNLFSPIDYSSRDAFMSMANRAGRYATVVPEAIGNYVSPRRFDRNYWNTKALANNAAQLAGIDNASAGNRSMATALRLAANLNYINTLGELARQGELFNAELELKEATFNRGTNQFNAELALKASMANQDAFNRAQTRFGEYYTKGLAMGESAKQARDAAINAGLSSMASGVSSLYLNAWLNDLLSWRGRRVNAPGASYGEGEDSLLKDIMGIFRKR